MSSSSQTYNGDWSTLNDIGNYNGGMHGPCGSQMEGNVNNPSKHSASTAIQSGNGSSLRTSYNNLSHYVENNKDRMGTEESNPEEKARARSERKRCREKQRRSDVNYQFSELTVLLRKIEVEDISDNEEPKAAELSTSGTMNRIDLIARTISVLSRIHSENRKRRRVISELQAELSEMKKKASEAAGSVSKKSDVQMMMVPMMVPSGSQTGFMPQSMFYPSMMQPDAANFPMMAPFMPQSMFYPSMMQPDAANFP